MAEPVGAVDKAGIRIGAQRPPTAPSVPAARTLETFTTLATVERDGRRVSVEPSALTSRARLDPLLPAPPRLTACYLGFSVPGRSPMKPPHNTQPSFTLAIPSGNPKTLNTHRGSPESCRRAQGPQEPERPFFPAESAPSCGREEISHVPQRGVFLSWKELGQGHSCLLPKSIGLVSQRSNQMITLGKAETQNGGYDLSRVTQVKSGSDSEVSYFFCLLEPIKFNRHV